MRIIRWIGIAGALLPGLLLAQNESDVAEVVTGEVVRQVLPEAQPSPTLSEAIQKVATPSKEREEGNELSSKGSVAGNEPGGDGGSEEPKAVDNKATSSEAESSQANGQPISEDASAVVAKLNQAVLEAMRRADELGYQGRFQLLAPVIREVYDFKAISRHVLGEYWKQLGDEQKQEFVQKMTEYGISEYAGQFDGYDGEKFLILSEAPFRKRYRVVKARLEVPKGDDVEFVYILRQTKEGWKIIDVRYDGVSDLALKRGQFAEILESGGIEKLMSKLDEKIANYARGKKEKKKTS